MKKNTKRTDIIILAVLIVLIAAGILFAVLQNDGSNGGNAQPASAGPVSYTDYNGKRLGIITGSSFEQVTLDNFPDSEYLYFNSTSDTAAALSQGKIDGFLSDEPSMRMLCAEQKTSVTSTNCLRRTITLSDSRKPAIALISSANSSMRCSRISSKTAPLMKWGKNGSEMTRTPKS